MNSFKSYASLTPSLQTALRIKNIETLKKVKFHSLNSKEFPSRVQAWSKREHCEVGEVCRDVPFTAVIPELTVSKGKVLNRSVPY